MSTVPIPSSAAAARTRSLPGPDHTNEPLVVTKDNPLHREIERCMRSGVFVAIRIEGRDEELLILSPDDVKLVVGWLTSDQVSADLKRSERDLERGLSIELEPGETMRDVSSAAARELLAGDDFANAVDDLAAGRTRPITDVRSFFADLRARGAQQPKSD